MKIFQVDAFTKEPFAGNPAAVCLLSEPCDAKVMQGIAREMNLSETAFLHEEGDGFCLRWFTPAVEVDLCGHATLAAAHILWETGRLQPEQEARFHTRSGLLTAEGTEDGVELNFPATPAEPARVPSGLEKALGVKAGNVGRSRFDYLVEVDSEETLRNLQPDMSLVRTIETRGIIVTSRSIHPGTDFVSRFFAPRVGVDEDPVTGSAHCCLGPYWAKRLGKTQLSACQASPRGGTIRVRVTDERVYLAGQAVTVMRGELLGLQGG